MGTSVSQASPATPLWLAANESYRRKSISIDRVVKEIWRATSNDPRGLAEELCSVNIQMILNVALSETAPAVLSEKLSDMMAEHPSPSIAMQIVCRAAIQTCTAENRTSALSERVFSEAAHYLLSRDMSGCIGTGDRIENVASAFQFKHAVLDTVAHRVSLYTKGEVSKDVFESATAWTSFSNSVISFLARTKGD